MIKINLFSEITSTLCSWGNNSLFEKEKVPFLDSFSLGFHDRIYISNCEQNTRETIIIVPSSELE